MAVDKENIKENVSDEEKVTVENTEPDKAEVTDAEEIKPDETKSDDEINNRADDCSEEVKENENSDDASAEGSSADSSSKETKKKLFGKKESKKDKKDLAIEELTDKHQRLMAEFQNFRSRTEKEKSAMYEIGAKSIIEKILPVVDNFERGLTSMSEEDKASPLGQGMEMIYKQFLTALEDMGVKAIEAIGKEFDPNFHNAVMHIDDEELEENIVVEEFQKGYMYHDAVVRHSMVKVAN